MIDIEQRIKEAFGNIDNLTKNRSKLWAFYTEYDKFADSSLHEGYFCYNCIYWVNQSGGRCVSVQNSVEDVLGRVSSVIAPHGCCMAYEANPDKLHDTRIQTADLNIDREKNKEKVTTADVCIVAQLTGLSRRFDQAAFSLALFLSLPPVHGQQLVPLLQRILGMRVCGRGEVMLDFCVIDGWHETS
ncbi:MAG TPA: hypothetical protein VNI77_03205 [Nitrososphaera sp.]|nr:hypothetical protein [Nitrososphaera sp.]